LPVLVLRRIGTVQLPAFRIRIELGLSIRIRILDPDLGWQEITYKKERKKKFMFARAGYYFLDGPLGARKSFVVA
jgi:hypothetical protein